MKRNSNGAVSVSEQGMPALSVYSLYSDNQDAAFRLYCREVAQVALLSPDEEKKLARKVRKGDKKAREHMIKANLRIVIKIAHDYENHGLPLLDLIGEGNMGLMKAVDRFDPDKGAKLSSYASFWIKQYIRLALSWQSRTIRLPIDTAQKLWKLNRFITARVEQFGEEPSNEEIAKETKMSLKSVCRVRLAQLSMVSLQSAPESGDDTLGDIIPDESIVSPDMQAVRDSRIDMVRDFLQTLEPREAQILHYRYGLDGGEEEALHEVGARFELTRERIRQIQNATLKKLRGRIERSENLIPRLRRAS